MDIQLSLILFYRSTNSNAHQISVQEPCEHEHNHGEHEQIWAEKNIFAHIDAAIRMVLLQTDIT